MYVETTHLKFITTVEGPLYNPGLDSANQMKMQVTLNLPSYDNKNINKEEVERKILKTIQSNIFLDKHKKALLKINFDILEYNCEFFHYCIMSACLCSIQIGIEQKGVLLCSNICIMENKEILVDPIFEEEKKAKCKFQIACLVDTEEVVSFNQEGILEEGQIGVLNNKFNELVAISIAVCKAYRNYLMKYL